MINPLDAAIVLAFAVSALMGLWRGFLREALALAGWVAAAWAALTFTPLLARALGALLRVVGLGGVDRAVPGALGPPISARRPGVHRAGMIEH